MADDDGMAVGLDRYWFRWQVGVCAMIILIPTVVSIRFIGSSSSRSSEGLKSVHLWMPYWRNLHPLWLLLYRAFAFISLAYLLYLTVAAFGTFVFYFYTQWTFILVMVYFALGTVVSLRGCWLYFNRSSSLPNEETDNFMVKESNASIKLQPHHNRKQFDFDQHAGCWEHLMQNVYQACAGAAILTDVVFWCLLLPSHAGDNFTLTLLIGCMHSLNAVFLLLDSALNSLLFPWYGLTYFVLWSSAYVTFQWVLHACGITWWPYPFLELANPWAPLWYFSLALIHIPCYGIYLLIVKAKGSMLSRMFPQAFTRVAAVKKQL